MDTKTAAIPLLLVTASSVISGKVIDLVQPLGGHVFIAADLDAARRWLDRSELVLIGADQLPAATPAVFGPRRQVFVIAPDGDPDVIALAENRLGSVVVFWLPAAAQWLTDLLHTNGISCLPDGA